MLTKRRKEELAWLYLVYTKALELPTASVCSPLFLLRLGKQLIRENKKLFELVPRRELWFFFRDLERIFARIETSYKNHTVRKYALPAQKRRHFAYLFVVCMTRREFWWLGHYSNERMAQFTFTHNINEKESRAFFAALLRDVKKYGHANDTKLHDTTT